MDPPSGGVAAPAGAQGNAAISRSAPVVTRRARVVRRHRRPVAQPPAHLPVAKPLEPPSLVQPAAVAPPPLIQPSATAGDPTPTPARGDEAARAAAAVAAGGTASFPTPPSPNPSAATHLLSPTDAKYLRIYETFPSLPSSLRKRGRIYRVAVQLCIDRDGRVADVMLVESADQQLDASVVAAVHTWRYRPLLVAGVPSPFCHRVRLHYWVQ